MKGILATLYEEMIPAVVTEMQQVLAYEDGNQDQFFGMMHYHMGWVNADLTPATAYAGKHIRPLLCLLTCHAAGGDWRQAVPAAAAVELLHNFSLVHDDIQDVSPLRRGRATMWKLWGVAQAINCGDAMFAKAHTALNGLAARGVPAETVVQAWRRFDDTCIALTRGQYRDMRFEQTDEVTVADYLDMIGGKTAALLALCTELGALVAAAAAPTIAHYAAFGRDLGLTFQVRDDILGIWGEEAQIGKSVATDIVTRKKSLPVLFALAKSERLQYLYRQPATAMSEAEFVQTAVALLDSVGAQAEAMNYEKQYAASSLASLEAAAPQAEGDAALRQLTDKLLGRTT